MVKLSLLRCLIFFISGTVFANTLHYFGTIAHACFNSDKHVKVLITTGNFAWLEAVPAIS